MNPSSIIALALAMFLLALVPGPGVMATVARALASGFTPALSVIGGIVAGDLIFLLSAIYGLSHLAEILGGFFVVVKIIGGSYLIWLGVRLLLSGGEAPTLTAGSCRRTRRSDFLSGLAITLGNPKVVVFYLSFLPAFMNLSDLTAMDVLITATVVSVVLGGVMTAYALAAARARNLISNARVAKRMNQTAGAILIGSGSLLIAKSQ